MTKHSGYIRRQKVHFQINVYGNSLIRKVVGQRLLPSHALLNITSTSEANATSPCLKIEWESPWPTFNPHAVHSENYEHDLYRPSLDFSPNPLIKVVSLPSSNRTFTLSNESFGSTRYLNAAPLRYYTGSDTLLRNFMATFNVRHPSPIVQFKFHIVVNRPWPGNAGNAGVLRGDGGQLETKGKRRRFVSTRLVWLFLGFGPQYKIYELKHSLIFILVKIHNNICQTISCCACSFWQTPDFIRTSCPPILDEVKKMCAYLCKSFEIAQTAPKPPYLGLASLTPGPWNWTIAHLHSIRQSLNYNNRGTCDGQGTLWYSYIWTVIYVVESILGS